MTKPRERRQILAVGVSPRNARELNSPSRASGDRFWPTEAEGNTIGGAADNGADLFCCPRRAQLSVFRSDNVGSRHRLRAAAAERLNRQPYDGYRLDGLCGLWATAALRPSRPAPALCSSHPGRHAGTDDGAPCDPRDSVSFRSIRVSFPAAPGLPRSAGWPGTRSVFRAIALAAVFFPGRRPVRGRGTC